MTNVFSESMNRKVYRLQHDGLLRDKSVSSYLPAYNNASVSMLLMLLFRLEKHMGLIESEVFLD